MLDEKSAVAWNTVMLDLAASDRSASKYAEALERFEIILDHQAREAEPDMSQAIEAHFGKANALVGLGRYDESEPLFREALDMAETHFGPTHSRVNGVLSGLATLERMRDNDEAAIMWAERLVSVMEASTGTTYPALLSAKNNLALAYGGVGRRAEEQAMLREVISLRQDMDGPEGSSEQGTALKNLSTSLHLSGDYDEAMTTVLAARVQMEQHLPPGSPYQATHHFTEGLILLDRGDPADAESPFLKTEAILVPTIGEAHYQVQVTRCMLAESYRQTGRMEEAKALAGPALEGMLASGANTSNYIARCQSTNAALAPIL